MSRVSGWGGLYLIRLPGIWMYQRGKEYKAALRSSLSLHPYISIFLPPRNFAGNRNTFILWYLTLLSPPLVIPQIIWELITTFPPPAKPREASPPGIIHTPGLSGSSLTTMLKPFRIRDLHRSASRVQEEPSDRSNSAVQISAVDYDHLASTYPRARLSYLDDDDDDNIEVRYHSPSISISYFTHIYCL